MQSLVRPVYIAPLYRLLPAGRKASTYESAIKEADEEPVKLNKDVVRYRKKEPRKTHFIENLFLGIFEYEVLEYPEIRTKVEVDYLLKHQEQTRNLVLPQKCSDVMQVPGKLTTSVKEALIENEVMGMKLKLKDQGLGYFHSESSFIQEALSLNPSLGKVIAEQESCGYDIICLFGSEDQKKKYLTDVLTGKYIFSLAHLENGPWIQFEPSPVQTIAEKLPNGSYSISGFKTSVYNPNEADIVIVSARVNGENADKNSYSLFIVDKNSEGLSVQKPVSKLGMDDTEICDIVFDKVLVPEGNIIGDVNKGSAMIERLLSRGKLCNGAQCISLMRKLINDTVKHCIVTNQFNKPLYDFKYVQGIIGQLTSALYSAESMNYLLTGRLDLHEGIDVRLESLIVKVFCSEALCFTLHNCIELTKTMNHSNEFIDKLIKDCYFFSLFDDPNEHLKLFLATAGVKYTMGQWKKRTVKGYRKKSAAELKLLKNFYCNRSDKKLSGYLHLTFKEESEILGSCIHQLNYLTEYLIHEFGNELFSRKYELEYLSEILITIYEVTAVLGRASRSYCIGCKYTENETRVARNIAQSASRKCDVGLSNIFHYLQRDVKWFEVGRRILDQGKYEIQHPSNPIVDASTET